TTFILCAAWPGTRAGAQTGILRVPCGTMLRLPEEPMESAALTGRLRSILGPVVAIGLGVLAFLACFDPRVLDATELGWVSRGDIATNFLGWHFFRYE